MINIYLAIDFGSTYTKLTAIDLENKKVLAASRALTTVKTDVIIGYNKAFNDLIENLDKNIGKNNYEIVEKKACSSAAGGLKIIAIGLVPDLTLEAAKKAAFSSGGKVIKTFSFELTDENIEEIKKINFDIVILSGGTNGGNREYILKNAKKLAENEIQKPIIIAGNEEVQDEIKKLFLDKNIEFYITENVMPVVNKINIYPVREVIRQVFIKNIIKAKGMKNVEELLGEIVMPTPLSVMKAAELFSKGIKGDGIGEIMLIDIGGATTDVHSIAKGLPKNNNIQLKGLEEPYEKRTVEGDLGMRYSAMSLYESTTLNKIRSFLGTKDSKIDIKESFKFREENPNFISETEEEIIFDEMMAKICTEISVERHAGRLDSIYSPMGTLFVQKGKDLTGVKNVIGTGGIIVNSRDPKSILELSLYNEESLSLKPKFPKFLVDKKYILAAMGLLSENYPEIAFEIMKNELVEV